MFLLQKYTGGHLADPLPDMELFVGNTDISTMPPAGADTSAKMMANGVPGYPPYPPGADPTSWGFDDGAWPSGPQPMFNDGYFAVTTVVAGSAVPSNQGTEPWVVRKFKTLPPGPTSLPTSDGLTWNALPGECVYWVRVTAENQGALTISDGAGDIVTLGVGFEDAGSASWVVSAPANRPLLFVAQKTVAVGHVFNTCGFAVYRFPHYLPPSHLLLGAMGEARRNFKPRSTFDIKRSSVASSPLTPGAPSTVSTDCGVMGSGLLLKSGWTFAPEVEYGFRIGSTWRVAERDIDTLSWTGLPNTVPLVDVGIVDALSLQFTPVAVDPGWFASAGVSGGTKDASWLCGANITNDILTGIVLETRDQPPVGAVGSPGSPNDTKLSLYYHQFRMLSTDITNPPAAGQVVKIVTDFTARLATVTYDGVVQGTLDFSSQGWYTADGSLI